MRYDIHFRRDHDKPHDYALIAISLPSLEAARDARKVSGDLVVYAGTTNIVKNKSWLWDWEKADPDVYAQLAIKFG